MRARSAPAFGERRHIGVVERRSSLEDEGFDAVIEMENLAGAPVMGADPLAGEHLAHGDDDRLLVFGTEVRLRRIADRHDRACLELGIGRAFDRVDVRHRRARPLARVGVEGRAHRIESPQLLEQLAAEGGARAESADAIVRPRSRRDPGPQPCEFGEIGARRMRSSRGRAKPGAAEAASAATAAGAAKRRRAKISNSDAPTSAVGAGAMR
jgi:hypothetical protein